MIAGRSSMVANGSGVAAPCARSRSVRTPPTCGWWRCAWYRAARAAAEPFSHCVNAQMSHDWGDLYGQSG